MRADLFSFVPPRRFDVVFFSFWISHVPADRWRGFWALVGETTWAFLYGEASRAAGR